MQSVIEEKLKEIEKNYENKNFSHWKDWKWQLKNSITKVSVFERLLNIKFTDEEREELEKITSTFPLSITPYYLSLIDSDDYKHDPIFLQAFPSISESMVGNHDMEDPLHEDKDSPVPGITHRYPDRVLFHISNVCAMYCRHCTRKRKVGDISSIPDKEELKKGIDYIRNTPEVRDVLLSGGDALLLSDEKLDWILTEIQKIPHVEVIRIGSRVPVVLPYRITDDLVNMLKKHHPIWINTHFNHPRELTEDSKEALRKLADAGIPLGNQSVLLAGINDCPEVIKKLCQQLVKNRVRPYYLYQCDLSEGLAHFRTPVSKGIEIMERLIGHTSGFAIPRYVIDAPGGGGKIPVMPSYLISSAPNKVILRNYEGIITSYKEPDTYKNHDCSKGCENCKLIMKTYEADKYKATGIEKLLLDSDDTISLIPKNNNRLQRREDIDED
ncbi:lysine 2,3-aminomutase [Clostridium sp. AWRP]|uniref:lysine 2,3-aminomutase n=1 Tax=Clostridium sp. AWRP TaxID=2212991 RepID=UPI000FD8B4A9|nr:lysine 2,3-aminomutase [Clostridium sp. AWRP]AZV58534.1 lysine 2,3-aminomutase [Clostridium sp. AWRP]